MENRDFIPYQSFGLINFGDSLDEVRKRLNAAYSQVYFSPESTIFHDYYDDLGLRIEYDNSTNIVLSIEAFNDMNLPLYFLGKNLTPLSYAELEQFFKENDPSVEPFSIGFYSPKFGISICFEDFDVSPDDTTSSFAVVCKDYMDLNR
jgi:hypothetical protein